MFQCNNFFCEKCYNFCYYKNLHKGHKLIELSDMESLKKEIISIQSTSEEFNELSLKINELKNKIELEITKINNLYDKIVDNITKRYLKKHGQL